jgi:hypothetical protein
LLNNNRYKNNQLNNFLQFYFKKFKRNGINMSTVKKCPLGTWLIWDLFPGHGRGRAGGTSWRRPVHQAPSGLTRPPLPGAGVFPCLPPPILQAVEWQWVKLFLQDYVNLGYNFMLMNDGENGRWSFAPVSTDKRTYQDP